jgi:hypothetical protein
MAVDPNKNDGKRIDSQKELYSMNLKQAEHEKYVSLLLEKQIGLRKSINELEERKLNGDKEAEQLLIDANELYNKQDAQLKQIVLEQNNINKQLQKELKNRQAIVDNTKKVIGYITQGWKFLQEQDKTIRSTVLNLGLSGTKASQMRLSFEQSAVFAARLGANLEDISKIQQTFTEETGKAQTLTSQTMKDILLIGKGTGLGVEQASKLVGQFDFMGVSSKNAMENVQGVLDTSERMGINSNKVLKNVSDNFKKLSTFTFQNGVKSFAQMAVDAERTRVSMSSALNLAESKRGLEDVIEMSANLQVMGGKFAEIDPFQWLYMVRNEPEKITEKISDMTKGMYSLKKNSEGLMEKFITPADKDRLDNVAKTLGFTKEEMHEIAQKSLDIGNMEKNLAGKGFTEDQKKMIQGAAKLNQTTGKYQVMLGGTMRDISTLTKDQAKAFESEKVTLEERAKEAMTFDETFKATINMLKASLLPLLNAINKYLLPPIKWLADLAGSGWGGLAGTAGILLAAARAWKVTTNALGKVADKFVEKGLGGFGKNKGGDLASSLTKGRDGKPLNIGAQKAYDVGQVNKMKASGTKNLKSGAGMGAALVGAGAGIALAAVGISKLADSMSKLTDKQADTLVKIVDSLLIFMGIAAGLAAAIMIFGRASTAASTGLIIFGGAVLMVGVGVGIAAAGIGVMAAGLGILIEKGTTAGDSLFVLAGGMAGIAASLMLFTAGSLGLITFGATMAMIAMTAPAITKVGAAFKEINAVMSGSKEDYIAIAAAINSIADANTKSGGMFADLANIMKTPLKVQFVDKGVSIASNITLNVDGRKLAEQIGIVQYTTSTTYDQGKGTRGPENVH